MRRLTPSRTATDSARKLSRALASLLAAVLLLPTLAFAQPPNRGMPRVPIRPPVGPYRVYPGPVAIQGPHLSQWMELHRNLNPDQQRRALASEPGFRLLPPEQQMRSLELLNRLNSMPPQQRQNYIARTEAMQQLAPEQRQQVRGAMQQLGSLPPERRRVVARVFRDVRNLPEPQRQNYLNSPQMRGVLTEQERGTLYNLITVNPYIPQVPVQSVPQPVPARPYQP